MLDVKCREFITLSAVLSYWPLAARGQQAERVRVLGVLMPFAAEDRQAQARLAALLQGLKELGWVDGRNLRIEIRWGPTNSDVRNMRRSWSSLHLTSFSLLAAIHGYAVANRGRRSRCP